MDADIVEENIEAEVLIGLAENMTEVSTAVFENITEVTRAVFENITEVTSAVFENITEKTVMMAAETPAVVTVIETTMASLAAATNETTTEHELNVEDLRQSMDSFFLIINSMLIFFLQGGFAFLEAGSVRSKNTTNILIKNLLDILLACVAFWVFGYMFAYSEGNTFIGTDIKYICSIGLEPSQYAHWFWQFVFCATAATIVSGAVAERCDLTAYFAYSIGLAGLVYPVVAHWAWTPGGWLAVNGYIDFAGSGVVHHLGGVCGFVGAVFLGPRIGRFDARGKPMDIPGHSVPLASLGAFILLFGFFAFNGSTQGAIGTPEDMLVVQRAVMNTMIGGCSSGLTTLIMFRYTLRPAGGKWSLLSTINGTLCGMITTCAFCNLAEPHVTFIVGIFSAFVYAFIHFAMIWLKIDDPLDAVAVHSGGGILGVLVTPLVIGEGGVFDADNGVTAMHQIWSQLVGIMVITAWSAVFSCILFYVLKLNNLLRVSREVELQGLDIVKHGEAAYPAEAWREIQYGHDGDDSLPPVMKKVGEKDKMKDQEFYEMKENRDDRDNESVRKEASFFENKMVGTWSKVNKELRKQMINIEDFKDSEVVLTVKPKENRDDRDNESVRKEASFFENKIVGTWSKVNKELRKQMMNIEDFKDSEVVLTVKPIGFRKLSSESRLDSESDTASTVSSELEKKPVEDYKESIGGGGFTNAAFEDSVDYAKPPQDNEAKPFQETHFGGNFRNIDEEIQKKLDQVRLSSEDNSDKPEDIYVEEEGVKKDFHSSTLRLDAAPSASDTEGATMEFGDDSYKEGDAIYEQLSEHKSDNDPLANMRQRVLAEGFENTTLEFNNSRESSMI